MVKQPSVFTFPQAFAQSNLPTTPYAGQKPGTSGLRKKTTEVLQP